VPNAEQPKLRASKLGGFMLCGQRAAMDVAAQAMAVEGAEDAEDKPIPAFGSFVHWVIQKALRSRFVPDDVVNTLPPAEYAEDVAAAAFPSKRVAAACKLFGDDISSLTARCNGIAAAAIPHLPKVDGTWIAEQGLLGKHYGGHIDLLSDDLSTIVDIKTCGSVPDKRQMSEEYFWQIIAYAALVEEVFGVLPERGYILYVDRNGEFVLLTKPVLYHHRTVQHAIQSLRNRCAQLVNYDFHGLVPTLQGCRYCPFRAGCRDQMIPAASKEWRRPAHTYIRTDPFSI